jgi:hypothetical protein
LLEDYMLGQMIEEVEDDGRFEGQDRENGRERMEEGGG